jgi:hypothetical protein
MMQGDRKEKSRPMYEGDPPRDSVIASGPDRNLLKLVPWLAAALFIFALLYRSSYFALLWLPSYQGVDMTSQLHADYGAWDLLVFQPVDPAVIEEIMQERELPEQIIVDGSIWPTPAGTLSTPPEEQQPSSTPQPKTEVGATSSVSQTPYVESPQPTSKITLPESTVTPQPTAVVNPAKPRKTPRPPRTPKPDKPPKTN